MESTVLAWSNVGAGRCILLRSIPQTHPPRHNFQVPGPASRLSGPLGRRQYPAPLRTLLETTRGGSEAVRPWYGRSLYSAPWAARFVI